MSSSTGGAEYDKYLSSLHILFGLLEKVIVTIFYVHVIKDTIYLTRSYDIDAY